MKLRAACSILKQRRESFARIMTEEMGKPYAQSLAEVMKCADHIEYATDYTPSSPEDEH